jgi:hypothetical protein
MQIFCLPIVLSDKINTSVPNIQFDFVLIGLFFQLKT